MYKPSAFVSDEIEANTHMVAVQLPPFPRPSPVPGTRGHVTGPAIVVPMQNEQAFIDAAEALEDVPGALRITSRTGKIQWRRNPGKRGSGHIQVPTSIHCAAPPVYAMGGMRTDKIVPDLAGLANTMAQALRGMHEIKGKNSAVHVVLDPAPGVAAAERGAPPLSLETLQAKLSNLLRIERAGARVHLWLVAPHRWSKLACATAESLRLQNELAESYGWLEGATTVPRKGKTYATTLRQSGEDARALHYESEALKYLCLQNLPSLELLYLAKILPPLGLRLRVVESASTVVLARALLGTPPEQEPVPPRTVEMWMIDNRTQARLPPAVGLYPMVWSRGAHLHAETCSTPESRMSGEMDPVRDMNVRVVAKHPTERHAEPGPRGVGFMVQLQAFREGGGDINGLSLQYQVDGGEVQTEPVIAAAGNNAAWEHATGASTADLIDASEGHWILL